MTRIWETVGLMCLSLLAGASTAWAMTPVSPEQILCGGEYIFEGRVIAVANKDCRLGPVPATCKQDRMNDVELRIVVTRLMGARKTAQGLRVGQTVTAQSFTYTSPFNTGKYIDQGVLAFRAPHDALLPNEWLHAAYVGQEFIFSGSANRVLVWPPDKAQWAKDAMAQPGKLFGGDCSLPL
ncbi:MAG: hypothetical protein Q8L22_11895 [Reyranella sp.]|nr:hypothetical protein [Reyranella sp.]